MKCMPPVGNRSTAYGFIKPDRSKNSDQTNVNRKEARFYSMGVGRYYRVALHMD